jgi:NAD(P)-dependent dehydrogenase (short-subunit alcohol dehydrogenase family)
MTSSGEKKLSGKTALITGGSRGIGKAVATGYARQGAEVFLCARSEAELEKAVAEIKHAGGRAGGRAGDVGSLDDARRIVQSATDQLGRIDVLVNNASLLGPRETILSYPPREWEKVLRVNLTGIFFMTQEVLKRMLPRRQGSIINVSSGVGRVGRARWGAYAVSKFGVEGITQILAAELKDCGIRANVINPGPTRTTMRASAYPEEDPLTLPVPEDLVPVFVYFAADDSANVTGQSIEAQDWLKRKN